MMGNQRRERSSYETQREGNSLLNGWWIFFWRYPSEKIIEIIGETDGWTTETERNPSLSRTDKMHCRKKLSPMLNTKIRGRDKWNQSQKRKETAVHLPRRWSLQLARIGHADEEQFLSIENFISIDQIIRWSDVRSKKIRQLFRRKSVGFSALEYFEVVALEIEERMYRRWKSIDRHWRCRETFEKGWNYSWKISDSRPSFIDDFKQLEDGNESEEKEKNSLLILTKIRWNCFLRKNSFIFRWD